jgi:hypothetical protein
VLDDIGVETMMWGSDYPHAGLTAVLREVGLAGSNGRGKGSHEVWSSPITRRMFAIPRNIRNPVLANEILKQAGLPKAF